MRTHYAFTLALVALVSAHAQADFKPRKPSPQAVPSVERYPEARCERVMESVASDLPEFCQAEPLDKMRLVDFGSQLDVLEQHCNDKEFTEHLKKALGMKAHRHDAAACRQIAEELRHSLPAQPGAQAKAGN
jgi:hypothetical protein